MKRDVAGRWVAALALGFAAVTSAASEPGTAVFGPTTWDGLYSPAQADRGQTLMEQHCVQCHAANLGGTQAAPAIAGVEMLYVWDGRSLAELLDYLRESMPPGQTGTITPDGYADIIAALLRANGFPAGEGSELPGDPGRLEQTIIRRQDPRTES
ncbi:cytochrome c [Elongatibacter sediminis]|uniref:Cytochrome c n=1 Tax=Elongatibacter sediminis TaxID=3119006 RepID=A0AAW9RI69_9GAMM